MAWGIIGVGQLASYILPGLRQSAPDQKIILSPRSEALSTRLAETHNATVAASNADVVDASDVVLVAVPPENTLEAVNALPWQSHHTVISLAAGVPIAKVANVCAPAAACRAMPVTAAAINESPTVMYPDNAKARDTLAHIGPVHSVDSEPAFEAAAITAVYFGWMYAVMDEVASWLTEQDVARETADALVAQMTRAAPGMALARGEQLAEQARAIGRPGTYTGMGLDELAASKSLAGFRNACEVVLAAARKPRV